MSKVSERGKKKIMPIIDIKKILINLCPKFLVLPLRFYYRKIRRKHESEILILKDLVGENGKRAIDIGANEGIYSYALSKICEVVEAFEPQPWCCETIVAYSQYSKNNINVHNVGLSKSNNFLNLYIPVSSGRLMTYLASFRELEYYHVFIKVPIHRLDDYNFQQVSFIKIDVEGHESEILKGGRETIIREKPVLLVEIEQRYLGSRQIEDVFNEIETLGYEGSFLYKGKLITLSEFSYEKHQKQFLEASSSRDIESNPGSEYVNNFIFKPTQQNIRCSLLN